MKKVAWCFLAFLFLFSPSFVFADTIISDPIIADTTWSPDGGVYVIDSRFSVASGTTLTIEPGTIIKAKSTDRGGPSIYGKLIAHGTSELPIIFTSQSGEIGDWQGLYFKEGSIGDFNFVDISYSGYGGYGYGNFVGVENDGGTLNIQNSNIHDNYKIVSNGGGGTMAAGTGIYSKKGTLYINNSIIDNNVVGVRTDAGTTTLSNNVIKNNIDSTGYGPGYGVYAYGPGKLTLLNNTFSGNDRTAMIEASKEFIHSGNNSSDIKRKAFQISGLLSKDLTLSAGDLPYIIDYLTVPMGITLNIEPGAIIKMEDRYTDGSITIQGGSLIAKGTKDAKIHITSLKDDTIGGDTNGDGEATVPAPKNWNAIFLENGSKAEFDNVVVSHGGYNYNGEYLPGVAAAIYQRGADFLVSNSIFEKNFGTAIYQDAGTTTIVQSELKNQDTGIWSRGGAIKISQSSFSNNISYGVFNQSGVDLGWWWQAKPLQIIDARNNWWGSADGPKNISTTTATGTGDKVSENVLYKPFLTENPLLPKRIDPVIIVPGIMGSATKNGKLLIDPILHTYDDLIATLEANGYEKEKNLFTFPYEWRDSNIITANLLKQKISAVKTICDCDKVDLVAHSMGGLVAREYIQSDQYQKDVDQLIFLGTPHKGSPKSYLQWEAGQNDTDVRSKIINKYFEVEAMRYGYQTVFDYIQNRPIDSVKELLPIFDYIKDDETGIMRTYSDSYYSDTYPENSFLFVLDRTLPFLLDSGIGITNITGDSKENKTIEKIRVKPTNHPKYWEHGKPDGFDGVFGDNGLERGIGDNTVTKNSATLENITNEEVLASHNRIPTVAENKIVKILTGKDSITNIDNGSNLSGTVLLLQLLSPIDMLITAPDGKRMGKNFETGEEYNEIEGAFYSGFETDEEYITIPNPLDGEYRIQLQGTGEGGEFGVVTNYVSDESSVSREYADTIKPGEIQETSIVTGGTGSGLSLEIKIKEIVPTVVSNISSSSRSGSGHRIIGEVLGATTVLDEQRELQLKLIEYLKQLISLYMLLLSK